MVLKNIVKKKVLLSQNNIRKNQLNITTNNIIKINGINKNLEKKILKISKISKMLGGKPILKNVSLSLNHGQILGLLGPNGAGKSTLFNLIVGKFFQILEK